MHSSGKNQESDIHCVIPEPQIGSRSCSISQLSSIRWLCGSDTRVNGDAVHRQKTGEYRIWWRRTASSNYNRGTLCCNTSTSHTSFTSFTFHLSFSFTEFTVCKSFSLKHCLTLFSLQLFFHSNTLSSVTSNQSHKYVEERHIVLIANSWPHLLPCTFCSHGDDCFAHAARLPSVRPLCVCAHLHFSLRFHLSFHNKMKSTSWQRLARPHNLCVLCSWESHSQSTHFVTSKSWNKFGLR